MAKIIDLRGNPVSEETPILTPNNQTNEENETEQVKTLNLSSLKAGYVVGVNDKSELVFEILGKDIGLVEMLGLHEYANHRIDVMKDLNQGYGIPLLSQQLGQVGQMLQVMLNMLTNQQKQNFIK